MKALRGLEKFSGGGGGGGGGLKVIIVSIPVPFRDLYRTGYGTGMGWDREGGTGQDGELDNYQED